MSLNGTNNASSIPIVDDFERFLGGSDASLMLPPTMSPNDDFERFLSGSDASLMLPHHTPSNPTLSPHDDSPIPIVDFGKFLHGSDADKKSTASQLDAAFRQVGFAYLQNHSIPVDRVDQCFKWSAQFFALATDTKMLCAHPPGALHHRGYSGPELEKASQHVYSDAGIAAARAVPDTKETFESGNASSATQPNIWPPAAAIPGFRVFMEGFFAECAALAHHVLRCLALALGQDPECLSGAHGRDEFQLRLACYPAVAADAVRRGERTRMGAHSDFGSVTVLFQDGVGGLEVEDPVREGVFRAATAIPGTCVVNVGDLMERWSNGRWKSTMHRVTAPPAALEAEAETRGVAMCESRYSIPFFAAPNLDAEIDALPGCWSETNPKKFEKVTAGEYIAMRMAALY